MRAQLAASSARARAAPHLQGAPSRASSCGGPLPPRRYLNSRSSAASLSGLASAIGGTAGCVHHGAAPGRRARSCRAAAPLAVSRYTDRYAASAAAAANGSRASEAL